MIYNGGQVKSLIGWVNGLMDQILRILNALRVSPTPYILGSLGILLVILALLEQIGPWVIWARQQLRLGILGSAMILFGMLLLVIPEFELNPATGAPRPTPTPFVTIDHPTDQLDCSGSGEICEFAVEGTYGDVAPGIAFSIYVFVLPIEPAGPGYYLQEHPARLGPDGVWIQFPSKIGGTRLPVGSGDSLQVRAALVRGDASFNDLKLDELPNDFYLIRFEDIQGLIALSETVTLTIEK